MNRLRLTLADCVAVAIGGCVGLLLTLGLAERWLRRTAR